MEHTPGATAANNLSSLLAHSAEQYPLNIAIKLDDLTVDYQQLEHLAELVAGYLKAHSIQPGDKVALISPNLPQMPAVYYGILHYGAVVVPLNPLLKHREFTYHFENSMAKLVFAWDAIAGEIEPAAAGLGIDVVPLNANFTSLFAGIEPVKEIAPVAPEDTAVILYTSGTTGKPKGAELTHHNLLANADVSRSMYSLEAGTVVFGGLPFFHVFGQTCALNAAIGAGATVTLLPKFDAAKATEIIERDKVEVFLGVPTMYIGLLRSPELDQHDYSSLRYGASGGAALPVEILHQFEQVFAALLLEGYGLSETSPVVCFNQPDGVRKAGSIGTPVPGASLKVVTEDGTEAERGAVGELAVAGDYVMKGYWQNPDATATAIRDGWFYTGDLATEDEDGVFFIVDRKKDMVLRGGYNVYPREVEEVVYEHPAVAEAAVIGIPDEVHGQEVAAVISLKSGYTDSPELRQEILDFVEDRIAAYKFPRKIVVIEELPKGPTGKILKRELTA